MIPKAKVISEIRRLAKANGKAPGQKLFQKETGIPQSYWNGNYWPRWSAALSEAGLKPNPRTAAIPIDELIGMYLELIVEIDAIPTMSELRMKARSDEKFPAASTFVRQLGPQSQLLPKVYEYAVRIGAKAKIVELLDKHIGSDTFTPIESDDDLASGTVYLLKSGGHYKIGRSSEIERRVKQISVAMPEKVDLIHAIQTDDTAGIENYWHRRFADKRLNGEWFQLTNKDVAAFRRRKFQ